MSEIPRNNVDRPLMERRYDVDWLRVLAMGTIFLFHCARFFDYEDWHVKNPVQSHGLAIFVMFTSQWIMPLFFILSGIGAYYALRRRSSADYVKERFLRLVVPLIFGVFTLVPPQVYIERSSHGQFDGSFFSFFPRYFEGLYGFGGNFAWMGLHLWYLEVLFVFSLLTLPLFRRMKRGPWSTLIERTASYSEKRWRILILVLPLFLMELLVDAFPTSLGIRSFGGWSLLVYLVFFIIGFILASDDRFGRSLEQRRTTWLILGAVTSSVGLFLVETGLLNPLPRAMSLPVEAALRAFNSWFWLSAIMGYGQRHLSFTNRALPRLNEAVLPFYILHQTVIVVTAFLLIGWAVSVPVKYLALAAISLVVIVTIYEALVRRIGVLRLLFGMRRAG